MKKRKLLLLALLLSIMGYNVQAQLSPGSIAFTGFNCDGDDDLAIVALDSLPPFTQIIFCDSEWNGTQFGTDEGDFTWNSGASGISAGTIISFTLVSSSLTPSQGSIAVNNAGGISGTSDAVFAFTGTPPRTVSTFIAAIANSSAAFGSFANTGLSPGLTAITLPEGSDIGQYNGPRSGMDKNGFLLALNTMSNWQIQDGSTDNQNDMIAPDLPWNMTPFTFTSIDATAPIVTSVSVLNQFSILINFSEAVLPASVTNLANYSFNPTLTIDSVFYQQADNTATLYHSGFQSGMAYTITVSAIEDLAGNLLNPIYISPTFYYNESIPALIFTEIMYNAPSSNSNQLEFVEIYNNGTSVVSLGGLVLKDAGNFVFTFPEMIMNPQSAIVLATDKTSAEAFYGGTFLDLPPAISNVFGNGGELIQLLTSNGTLICEVNYDDAAPWPTAPDGSGPSLELINASGSINDGANWTASTNLVGQSLGLSVFASPGVFTPLTTPTISFVNASQSFSESDGIVMIPVSISGVPAAGLDISLQLIEATAQLNTDFILSFTHHVNGPHLTDTLINIPVELLDNSTPENARFFTLEVSSNQANPGNEIRFIAFMLDDDAIAPVPTQDIYLSHVSSYLVKEGGSAEILSWDAASQRVFVVNSVDAELVILDFSSPENIQAIDTIDMSVYGSGITSVASRDGILAVTVENGPNANGLVVIFNADGVFQTSLVVGNLPDHLSFTPDGSKILTANEGQPSNDYLTDPEGTVTVIDISGGIASLSQSNVNTMNFNAFDTQLTALKNAGIRIFGPNATVSQDVEPEYITYNHGGTRAFVSLQENNAIAVVDLDSLEITAIWPMGYKNHQLQQNAFDGSDKSDTIIFANWPVKGMYMPDALAYYEVNGQGYYVTTNEGDAREYSAFEEEIAISALVLDSLAFPNRFTIQSKYGIGRMSSINTMGDLDQDGDMDELYVFGGRSFSIYNASTGEQVFDSGDDFERIIASHPVWSSLFNASNENNNFKNRSDNKGPEPEAITIHTVNGIPYAFIGLERMGGVMTYDLSNPLAPVFVDYINTRELGANEGGDLGPEGIIFIPYGESPTDTSLVVVANEISGTISVFSVQNEIYLPQNQDSSLSIFVFSDPHYMDTSLLINDGAAFQTYLAMDRKMLKESQAILEATIDTILAIHPDIVLVTGDLTKDGEYASHTAFASYLQTLENQGIKTFVIPGNHDINNPHALAFDGSSTIPVAHVSPAQFDSIYANFGFNEAIATDPNSLSYLVEPFPGFQILALDVCKYEDNLSQGHPETSGEIPYDTYEWINDKIAQANASGKYIIAMMHHGANEHYVGQSTLFSEYVVDGWDTLSNHFADMGLKAVFTGHYHAQDIVGKVSTAGHEMYDIETGSLVTWPSPFRLISMDTLSGDMSISGGVIENIDYNTNGVPFQTYAHSYLSTGLPLLVNYILMNPPYSLDAGTASSIEPVITEAFM
ncbi:MAG: choice-of-anchor I family protein, partial [Bacteroidales bacterium]|nr:choice-of-anchor I family protein [Bacteroidales bacterium]